MIDFNCDINENTLNFHFKGRLDTNNSREISAKVEDSIKEYSAKESDKSLKIVFDIKEVDYVASAFIRICLKAARAVDKGNFALVNSTPMIKKIFKIAGLADVLNVS